MEFDERDLTQLTDEILFNRYCAGDSRAFSVLLYRLKGLVFSHILRYVKNDSKAEELFQEIFFKVCKNKELFRENLSFKSWIVTITRNTCIDYLRKQKRSVDSISLNDTGEFDDQRSLEEMIPSEDESLDEQVNYKIEEEDLERLLDRLPEAQRETFFQKVVMDLTFEEIGRAMKCSTNTAKSRYRYAVKTLQALVKRERFLDKAG